MMLVSVYGVHIGIIILLMSRDASFRRRLGLEALEETDETDGGKCQAVNNGITVPDSR